MPLVSLNNFLHQAVAHYVPVVKRDESDAFHPTQHFYGIAESAAFAGRQVDLRQVAGHHHFRIESLASQHHLHLLRRAVLGFVQNDETVVQGSPAHERDGRNFNHRALQQLFYFIPFQHVVEGVIQGTQIRVYFFLHIAGQKPEPLTHFDSRPSQHDPAHPLVHERRNRHGDGQIRLSRSGGPEAEHQIVALNGFHIAALGYGLGRDCFLAEAALPAAVNQAAEGDFRIGGYHAQVAVQVAILKRLSFFDQREVVFQNTGRPDHVRLVPFNLQSIVHKTGANAQPAFEDPDVLIPGSEQGLHTTTDLHAKFHLEMRRVPPWKKKTN